jgi:hypothetical protein
MGNLAAGNAAGWARVEAGLTGMATILKRLKPQ